MVEVKPKFKDEPIESMIRRFKKKVDQSGIMRELWDNRYYMKPSERKRHPKIKVW
jgi:ribosomal protein S21